MKKIYFLILLVLCGMACKKDKDDQQNENGGIRMVIETSNGITYKLFVSDSITHYYGILVMGSGNDESRPTVGSLDGGPENDLCKKAARHGYIAAIVRYRATPGLSDWNTSAHMIGQDYDKCITTLAAKYGIDKTRSVIGGYSYASYMLLTNTADYMDLAYCRGLLAACGSTQSIYFHLPVYSIVCKGNNEGDLGGEDLYNAIPASSPFKLKSAGITDNSCGSHCGGNWTDQLFAQLQDWLGE